MEQELAIRLQEDGIHYQTQVEIPATTADFYFSVEPRPLLVFVDGRVHFGRSQMVKDEELRSLLRKRDRLYEEIRDRLARSSYHT
jgi:very-short-patch-repair endonuclease